MPGAQEEGNDGWEANSKQQALDVALVQPHPYPPSPLVQYSQHLPNAARSRKWHIGLAQSLPISLKIKDELKLFDTLSTHSIRYQSI